MISPRITQKTRKKQKKQYFICGFFLRSLRYSRTRFFLLKVRSWP